MSHPPMPPPGWYPTPEGTTRYWDGRAWTAWPPPRPGPYQPKAFPSPYQQAYPAPYPGTSRASTGVFAHLAGFVSIIVTLILFLVIDRADRFNRGHAAEALNFQITLLIASVVIVALGILTAGFGFVLFLPVIVIGIAWPIKAAIAASRFRDWRYPICLRMVSP